MRAPAKIKMPKHGGGGGRVRRHFLIAHKIAAIGAIGVLGVLTISGIYLTGASVQNKYRQAAAQASALSTRANNLYINMIDGRRAEKDFLLHSEMKYASWVSDVRLSINEDLAALAQDAAGDETLMQSIGEVKRNYEKYTAHFKALVDAKRRLGLDEKSGLQGELRASVHAIENKLKTLDDPQLMVTMLMMRRHEKDFMLRGDVEYGEDMKKRAAEFAAQLETAKLSPADKADITQKLATYQKDFFAWMDTAVTVAAEQRATSGAYGTIEPVIAELRKMITQRFADANVADEEARANTGLIMHTAIGLVAVVVLGLAIWIGRLVSRPIRSISEAMAELARGNMRHNVPGAERGDEIGTMAKAVLVFRDAAVEKTRLEAEGAERDRRVLAEKAELERHALEEKTEAERQAAAEREMATAKLMDAFDAAVGGIVQAAIAGDFSQRVPLDDKQGVIRNLAASMNTMCETVGRVFADVVRMLGALADGDLTSRITGDYGGAFATLKDNANATASRLAETIAEIKRAACEVANAADEISAATGDLSQRTEEQAASLEETSASMEQISSTVRHNADNARHASQSASDTCDVGSRGGAVVGRAVEAMSRIEESSHKIADIIGVIDEIARQTNLLALNAAVEAARAGEAGRGFAVVAAEVRNLAQRSSQAAKDIKDLITNSNAQVKDGVELVNRAGNALNEIVQSIKMVADIVADIATASSQQASGIDQVNKALSQMDEVTQQNSALVEQNAATARMLQQQSLQMDQRVSFFRIDAADGTAARAAAAGGRSAKRPPIAANGSGSRRASAAAQSRAS
jgi:methyl-accepting chemotaxis protein